MKKKWNAPKRIIIAIVLTDFLIAALTGILVLLGRFDDLLTNFVFAHMMYTTLGVLNTALIFWVIWKVDKVNPWRLGFIIRKKEWLFSLTAIIISLLTVLTFIWVLDILEVVTADFRFEELLNLHFYQLLGIAMIGWFFAALKEEVLARGYVMANLNHLSIPKAIIISALIFMALHFIMGDFDPFKAASWFKGGLVYAYIYLKSGSLTTSTIVHAAHNLVNDLVIHGSKGALVLLDNKVTTADKLVYEAALCVLLLVLTYLFYGKNGMFTPAENLKRLWLVQGEN